MVRVDFEAASWTPSFDRLRAEGPDFTPRSGDKDVEIEGPGMDVDEGAKGAISCP